jgi:hypothetical protein
VAWPDLNSRRVGLIEFIVFVNLDHLLAHPEPLPRISEDLYEMYNLTSLAAQVAREKPNGEKNALRSSYKGHMKRLGVAGHFNVHKKEEDAPSEFMSMIQVPDLEWSVHQVKGREISDGISSTTLANLGRAMSMAKGPIPKATWDTTVLGDLAPSSSGRPTSARPSAPTTPLVSTPGASNRPKPQLPPGQDPTRPRRNIKKRGYGDSSFEGYGEGFPDDEAGIDGGYSTGEGEGGQKRRKKVDSSLVEIEESACLSNTVPEHRKRFTIPERYTTTKLWPRYGWRVNLSLVLHFRASLRAISLFIYYRRRRWSQLMGPPGLSEDDQFGSRYFYIIMRSEKWNLVW